mmetsp:Transcript_15791/g.34188  ORF Transcript_15791/g.34188 Transcript_15791/m.34188 type:complete len:466 (+) Transcript_15791:61-1458(+)
MIQSHAIKEPDATKIRRSRLMAALSKITGRTMFKYWMAIISLIRLADAFSFPASTSRLFRPISLPTATSPGTVGAGSSRLSSSFQSLSISQLSFSSRNESIYPTKQRRRRRQRMSATSSESNDESSIKSSSTTVADDGEEELTILKKENKLLQERLKLLQIQNDELQKQQQKQPDIQQNSERKIPYEQRLILEDFEGESFPALDARGGVVDGWNQSKRRYTEPWDDEENGEENIEFKIDGGNTMGFSGPGEDEVCEYDDTSNKWMSGVGECPMEPNISFGDALKSRANWLVGLLAMQSCSGFILARNEVLLQNHPVIIYFLTMLVGAGGNAGNQASVRVIRGLALGTLNPQTQSQFLSRELRMAFALSLILSLAGFMRATLFQTPFPETMAVTLALSMIVFSSICLGAVLPLLLQKVGVDPAHSSTTIQVIMDILGVLLTVLVSTSILDSGWGKMLINSLGNIGF